MKFHDFPNNGAENMKIECNLQLLLVKSTVNLSNNLSEEFTHCLNENERGKVETLKTAYNYCFSVKKTVDYSFTTIRLQRI